MGRCSCEIFKIKVNMKKANIGNYEQYRDVQINRSSKK